MSSGKKPEDTKAPDPEGSSKDGISDPQQQKEDAKPAVELLGEFNEQDEYFEGEKIYVTEMIGNEIQFDKPNWATRMTNPGFRPADSHDGSWRKNLRKRNEVPRIP